MSADQRLIDAIDELLPQTQCGKCGYNGCRPYAHAIAAGEADINQCPPGGEAGIRSLAELLGRAPKPLDPSCGSEQYQPTVAWIDEEVCIGCTRCIQACPVDAILGATKLMHTVIRDECTGCELCLAPCPVDCIYMQPVEERVPTQAAVTPARQRVMRMAPRARQRYEFRQFRLERDKAELAEKRRQRKEALRARDQADKKAAIAAAVARVRAKKARQGQVEGR